MKAFTDEELSRLREALAEDDPSCAHEGCPNKEELWKSATGGLDPLENEAIILHLAQCSECSMIWRLAREMVLPDEISSPSVVALSDRGRWQTWRKVIIPAIAATMLIGVGLSAAWLVRKGASSPPVFRQQQDNGRVVASPRTQALPRSSCRLEWSGAPEGSRYDLIVTDGTLEILSTVKGLMRPEYDLPSEAIPTSATEVFWRVTAHLPNGRTVVSVTFTTEIDDMTPAKE